MNIYRIMEDGDDGTTFNLHIDGTPHRCTWVSVELGIFEVIVDSRDSAPFGSLLFYADQAREFPCSLSESSNSEFASNSGMTVGIDTDQSRKVVYLFEERRHTDPATSMSLAPAGSNSG